MLGEMLDPLNTMLGQPTLTFLMLGEVLILVKMLGDGRQQLLCFQMLDEMLDRFNTSANICKLEILDCLNRPLVNNRS